jgi:DNA adenine methylase
MGSQQTQTPLLKPPLKWAGGKRWLVPKLMYYWRKHRHARLVEPFCGGLSVALGLQPDRALLNDVNPALINFYQHIQSGLQLDMPYRNEKGDYYQAREHFNAIRHDDSQQHLAAQLFYYLNRTGYNGLCRFNKKGHYNVPFGRYKTINYMSDFSEYAPLLNNWTFSNADFETLDVGHDDFIYADPPYDTPFRQYAQQGFSWEDQVRLAEWLSQHTGPVVLSNQATTRIIDLYRALGFRLRYLEGPRFISCKSTQRQPVKEVLALRGI